MTLTMDMPWKFSVGLSLALFVVVLAMAPFLMPARHQLVAKINEQTLKAAAAIKSATNKPLPHGRVVRLHEGEKRPH